MVDNVLIIIYGMIELTNILLCYILILQAEVTKRKKKLCLAYGGIMLCNIVNIICGLDIEKAAINMFCCWIMSLLLMEKEKKKWLLLFPCAYLMSSILNITGIFFSAIVLKISHYDITGDRVLSLLSNMIFTLIAGIVFVYTRKKQRKHELGFSKMVYAVITVGSLSFLLIISAIEYFGMNYPIPDSQINLLGFLLSLVCVMFCFMFLHISVSVQRREQDKKEREMLNLYISDQEKQIELIVEKDSDMRRFRHDIREHMWIISQCIEKSDYESAKKYIDRVYNNLNAADIEKYTDVVALNAVISDKKRIMDEKGIRFIWEKNGKEIPKHIETYDICTLFINILNNAIEAVEKLDKIDREIGLKLKVENGGLYIMSRNRTYDEATFDGEGNPVTTKNDRKNHGLGGKNIQEVVKRYDGILEYGVFDGWFNVNVVI